MKKEHRYFKQYIGVQKNIIHYTKLEHAYKN